MLGVLTIAGEYSAGAIPCLAAGGAREAADARRQERRVRAAGPGRRRGRCVRLVLRRGGDPVFPRPVALGDAGVARAVVGEGLYLAVLGLFSLAIGTLLRHTAAAISLAIGVVFVLAIVAAILPAAGGSTSTTTCRPSRGR